MAKKTRSPVRSTTSSPVKKTKKDPDEENDEPLSPVKDAFVFEGVVYKTYQEMVNAKRERNQQMLRDSGLLTAREEMVEVQKRKAASTQGIKKRKTEKVPIERRKSKRIAGIESENIYVEHEGAGRFIIANDGNLKSEDNRKDESKEEQEHYRNRVNDGEDISIEKAVELTGSKWVQESSADNALQFVRTELIPLIDRAVSTIVSPTSVRSFGNNENDDDDRKPDREKIKENQGRDSEWLKNAADAITVDDVEKCVAKVVPDRIYGIAVHPSTDKVLAAAGDKSGYVGIWDVDGLSEENNGVYLFKYHSGAVSCLQWTSSGSSLFSGSYDGTVRVFDVEKECMVQQFATVDDSFSKDHLGYGLDTGYGFWTQYACIDHRFMTDQCFFLSTSDGSALHVDLRSKGKITFNQQWSEKKINTLR